MLRDERFRLFTYLLQSPDEIVKILLEQDYNAYATIISDQDPIELACALKKASMNDDGDGKGTERAIIKEFRECTLATYKTIPSFMRALQLIHKNVSQNNVSISDDLFVERLMSEIEENKEYHDLYITYCLQDRKWDFVECLNG